MSQYYNPKRTKGLFDPQSGEPFKLSRSKIGLFFECPRCFYLDRRLGVARLPGFPFTLNNAVDFLLKKEFDIHRADGNQHPLMESCKIDAVPFKHPNIDEWRDTFKGVSYHHKPTNFLVFGAIDDVWINPRGELHIVDYKATSKEGKITLDAEWQKSYKRQMEVYQWLFRKNDFKVSDTGYFVYANAMKDRKAFDGKLEFDIVLIPYKGSDAWVEGVLQDARACLQGEIVPDASSQCDFCRYRDVANDVLGKKSSVNRKADAAEHGRLF